MKQENKPTFEASLKELEGLLDKIEQGEIPLADLINHFEKGNELIHHCQQYLQEAELKIEQLKKGKLQTEPYHNHS